MNTKNDSVELMLNTAMQATMNQVDGVSRFSVQDKVPGHEVSTVKLSVNHGSDEKPLWYETMVFIEGTYNDVECERYETQEQAEKGHKAMVAKWKTKRNVT